MNNYDPTGLEVWKGGLGAGFGPFSVTVGVTGDEDDVEAYMSVSADVDISKPKLGLAFDAEVGEGDVDHGLTGEASGCLLTNCINSDGEMSKSLADPIGKLGASFDVTSDF